MACVAWLLLHHACWSALPERYRNTTPGKAVGLLFVPLFNFYWTFVSLVWLADGFNALRDEHPDLPIQNVRRLGIAKAIGFLAPVAFFWAWPLVSAVYLADAVIFVLFYRAIVANAIEVIRWNA